MILTELWRILETLHKFAASEEPVSELTNLVMQYKKTRSPMLYEQIEAKVAPLIQKHVQVYAASGLDRELLENQLVIYLKQAIDTYDPKKGPFEAYLPGYLKQIYRFVNNYQSALRLPENYKLQYSTFETTKNLLEQQLGREPTISEVASASGLPYDQVRTFYRRSIGALEEDSWAIAYDDSSLRQKEALAHVEAKYGRGMARAIEAVLIKGESLMDYCRKHRLEYASFYPKFRQARQDYEWFLNS